MVSRQRSSDASRDTAAVPRDTERGGDCAPPRAELAAPARTLGGTVTKYYYFGSQRVAMRQGTTLTYLYSDHLGSTTVTANSSGQQTALQTYYPYGAVRTGSLPTDYTFTGQKLDTSDSLLYYGARYYAADIGRFAQPDSIIPDLYNPQSLNRYSYAYNNPLNRNDPTGHFPPIVIFGVAIGMKEAVVLFGGGSVAIINFVQHRDAIAQSMERVSDSVSQMAKRGKEPKEIVDASNSSVGFLPTGNAMGTGGWKPPKSRLERIIWWGSVLATGAAIGEEAISGQDPTSPTTLYPEYTMPNQRPTKSCDSGFMCCQSTAPQCTYSGDLSLQDLSGDRSASDSSVTPDGQNAQEDTPQVPTLPADTGDGNDQYPDYTYDY